MTNGLVRILFFMRADPLTPHRPSDFLSGQLRNRKLLTKLFTMAAVACAALGLVGCGGQTKYESFNWPGDQAGYEAEITFTDSEGHTKKEKWTSLGAILERLDLSGWKLAGTSGQTVVVSKRAGGGESVFVYARKERP